SPAQSAADADLALFLFLSIRGSVAGRRRSGSGGASPPKRIYSLLSASPSTERRSRCDRAAFHRNIAARAATSRVLAAGDRDRQNMDVLRASQDMDVLTERKAIAGRQGAASLRSNARLAQAIRLRPTPGRL